MFSSKAQNVGINTTGAIPDGSSMLDVVSNDKGVLIPRLALTATNNNNPVTLPATSLLVYNTATSGAGSTAVTPGFYYWDGSLWVRIEDASTITDDWHLTGNAGTNASTNFIGTTDAVDFVVRTTNAERARVTAGGNVGIDVTAPDARLEVNFNSGNDFAAVKAEGRYGPTLGYLGVQGKTDFDGVTTADWIGNEIGVVGISTGTSSTDNYGVLGHSNDVGVRGENSGGANWAELGTSARSINANGDAYIDNGWLSVGGTTGATTRSGVFETTWEGSISFDYDGYQYYNISTFDIPNTIPNTVTVTKIMWEMDGYHEDANESHGLWIKFGTGTGGPWYGWTGNSTNGAKDVNWHYVSGALSTAQTDGTTISMRVEDDCCWGDDMRVFNLHIKIYYEYNQALQDGDIAASGRVYANSTWDVGDMAEYFELDPSQPTDPGNIVVLNKGKSNNYILSEQAYDPHMVGVISQNPSVVLNNPSVGPPVALAGRVVVKLKTGLPLIKSGDFLTTSDVKGRAMLATEPGPVIGYAVTNQKAGENEVTILLQPGRYYYPISTGQEGTPVQSGIDGVHSRSRN